MKRIAVFASWRCRRGALSWRCFNAIVAAIAMAEFATAAEIDFNRDIRPILSDRCFACHGPDEGSRESGLNLEAESEATAELASGGRAIVPGKPEESLLLERVKSDDESYRMPPSELHSRVTDEEIALLERWIQQGATYDRHWSFKPLPASIPPPVVNDEAWSVSPMDRFVMARLESEGLEPAAPADQATWLRRVTFDLTGLPPTPKELSDFLADAGQGAHERVVDRLLASPRFGERMATPWLDVARYADSYGYQSDLLSPTWPWRDWVIRALNDNLPYDQFLTWQIAGDLLPGATRDQRLATAFNRLHRMTNEGGSIPEEFRLEYVADRASTLGTAILGLTIECARCHDHKFDPISQNEFYQLTAFFDDVDEWGTYSDSERVPTPSMLLPTPEEQTRLVSLQEAVDAAGQSYIETLSDGEGRFQQWLAKAPTQATIPGLVAHFPLDEVGPEHSLANYSAPENRGSTSAANAIVDGRAGKALRLAGDEGASFPCGRDGLQPDRAFSVAYWMRLPENVDDGLIFHQSGGADVGYHGTEASLKDGRLFFGVIRFWPGNAIAVESNDAIPREQWVHVAITYDATNRASGMRIFIDGRRVDRIVRDNLYKTPQFSSDALIFGERFRDLTIPGLEIDEVRAYARDLTPIEVGQLLDGRALTKALTDRRHDELRDYYFANFDKPAADARAELQRAAAELLQFQTTLQETMVMQELPEPRDAFLLARGAYDAPKTDETRVAPGVPAALGELGGVRQPANRLALAHWLTKPDHPLTARVAVNRLWQTFFGRGLVESSENFGVQGTPPSHPELLDWLARDFVDSGWDVKRMCKQIVLSETYGQSSKATSALRDRDPQNELLARGPSARLSAEMVRDMALAASGLLSPEVGGPPASPYQPANLWTESNSMSPAYQQSVGDGLYRRSVYTVLKRTAPHPNMVAFDVPAREVCTARRSPTNTPIQALVLLNDVQFVEACRVLAQRMLQEGGESDEAQVRHAFVRLAGRPPTDQEISRLVEAYNDQRRFFAEQPQNAEAFLSLGNQSFSKKLHSTDLAAATVVAQIILNLDVVVWKR
jgi:hypothetical protein